MLLILLPLLVHEVLSVTVLTSRGPVVGQRAEDGQYETFFGVPYAQVNEKKPFEVSEILERVGIVLIL